MNASYRTTERFKNIATLFTFMAVLIASLGLVSYTLYLISRRYREIAIRKVLGGTSGQILRMIYRGFLKLIFMTVLIGLPAGYLLSIHWLDQFAFKISFSMWIFLLPVLIITVIMTLSVTVQSLRASGTNPAKVIRYE